MAELKDRLRADLSTAMKARSTITVATLRMVLTAITTEEVSGSQARELSDDEVLVVLAREAKKRRESAEVFTTAGRDELANRERSEGEVLAHYLPQQLSEDELSALVADTIDDVAGQLGKRPSFGQLGLVMKAAKGKAAGRAEGSRLAAAVLAALKG
ncbi:MAG: glutamyl-tRNA amidotransferase [Pseudonocardiales bacterium]|nr:GatB/YqeY domain-containing protein [Pseudonocardiales bacterium]PZS29488.1 MAG: glutamyl-tRNA amidotransferase [Pseudonocardiales bacterium]